MISEPMTLATDYLLGALAALFGIGVWRDKGHSAKRPLAIAFWSLSAASFLGGSYHGFHHALPPSGAGILWYLTLVSIGTTSAFLLISTSRAAFSAAIAKGVTWFAGIKLAAFCVWVWERPQFLWAIADYAPTMVFLLVVAGLGWARGAPSGKWAVGGVVVSFAAAGVQQSGFALHEHFNHNDLYHVVQMLGIFLLYRAGRLLDR